MCSPQHTNPNSGYKLFYRTDDGVIHSTRHMLGWHTWSTSCSHSSSRHTVPNKRKASGPGHLFLRGFVLALRQTVDIERNEQLPLAGLSCEDEYSIVFVSFFLRGFGYCDPRRTEFSIVFQPLLCACVFLKIYFFLLSIILYDNYIILEYRFF